MKEEVKERLRGAINELCNVCHQAAVDSGWHTNLKTGEPLVRNKGEMMMLMVSEISEAMEADRKNLMDDKLPHRNGVEVELADLLIRVGDFVGMEKLDIGGAIIEKMEFNANRADHKIENRVKEGGKKY